VRIIVADCEAEYTGRLLARLPRARRVIMVKADESVLIFSEAGAYKPLNWMAAPCRFRETRLDDEDGSADRPDTGADTDADTDGEEADTDQPVSILQATALKSSDALVIRLYRVYSDESFDLGREPGLVKDGVEDNLQHLLAEQIGRIGHGARLVRREFPTPVGPVDIMAVDGQGRHVAIEIKRHGGVDGVEQLTRYVHFLNEDSTLRPVRGMFAAQTITPQARTLAASRGFECLILDYDDMKKEGETDLTLF
jgi:RecB family endonuclease NucS